MRYPTKIAKALNESSIPSPKGIKWTKNVIVNILSNEKYYGDAILQKSFVVDFIFHATKKNEGELPQYYVRNDHPTIIKRATWDETHMIENHFVVIKTSQRYLATFLASSFMVSRFA